MTNAPQLTAETLVRVFVYLIIIIIGLFFLFIIRDILFIFLIAVILSLAFDGPIDWLKERGVNRFLATFFVYLFIFSAISSIFYFLSVPLVGQIKSLNLNLPSIVSKLEIFLGSFRDWFMGSSNLDLQQVFIGLSDNLTNSGGRLFGSIVNFLGGFISFTFVIIIAVYLNIRERGVKKFLLGLVPFDYKIYAVSLIEQIQKKMGNWVWGTLLDSLIVGIFVYLGLAFLGIDYALFLGVVAAVLNVIPYIGPFISVCLASLFALAQSPILVLWVIILYLFVNLVLEDTLIKPLIMKKAIGIDPLLIIFTVLVGGKIAGIVGVALAVPIAAIIEIVFQEYKRFRIKDQGIQISDVE